MQRETGSEREGMYDEVGVADSGVAFIPFVAASFLHSVLLNIFPEVLGVS